MAKNINVSRMTFQLEFGSQQPTDETNPNTDEPITEFKADFSAWAGRWSLTTEQTLTLAGAGIKDAAVFFVRHNENLSESMQLRYNKTDVYQIDGIAFDDGLPPDGFDLITCHRVVNTHA
ncbi:MAG: phage head closure protein [Liquorilactobacillus ghanensis]|uniref:phage head closure protein n=1 Tax=Liquorilactobacillus ghanensis TaxID=399370 RepID=UPI0039ED060E